MREIIIRENEAGQRLDKFLAKLLKEAPMSFFYKMLRKKNIVLNGKKASGSEKLVLGDSVKLFLSDETFEKFAGTVSLPSDEDIPAIELDIIYEDEDILMMNKPAGMLSQKAEKQDVSANEYVLQYLLERGTITKESLRTFRPSVCNRLDRNTSGILIVGKTLRGSQNMGAALKERSIQKYYLCLVAGRIEKQQRIEGYLKKDSQRNQVIITDRPQKDGKKIVTEYRPIEQIGDYTLLEVHLITGRSHQIRAHLASIHHPIIGDTKYGSKKQNRIFSEQAGITHQLLHAYRLVLEDGREITAKPTEEFERALRYLRERT